MHMTLCSQFSPATPLASYQDPPQSVRNQGSQGESDFLDGSGPIFSMYLEMAEEEDKKMAESWKVGADSILVFVRIQLSVPYITLTRQSQTGLFSASVASLISVSIQDIRQDPQDTSNFYLANIYQVLANPNRSSIPSSLPTSPPPFSPPTYAVWVNGLWFMSLVISITCAILATLLQQSSPFSPGNCDVVMMHYNAYNPSKYMMQRYIVTC
jgi:hypothetical protein